MSASDLPESGHSTPDRMARCLASYMRCPQAIRRAVLSEFGSAPGELTIRDMRQRAAEERRKPPPEPVCPHEGLYPDEVARHSARTSDLFLARLANERRAMPERAS